MSPSSITATASLLRNSSLSPAVHLILKVLHLKINKLKKTHHQCEPIQTKIILNEYTFCILCLAYVMSCLSYLVQIDYTAEIYYQQKETTADGNVLRKSEGRTLTHQCQHTLYSLFLYPH